MSWTTSNADLRKLLNDGATDKLRYRKRVIGFQNGTNVRFKTFEFRRVSTFVAATAPIGVFVDDAPVTVSSDDLPSGEFVLAAAPTEGQVLRATYYIQWFTDAELDEFLLQAAQFILNISNVTQIPANLQPPTIRYAAHSAYAKLALKFAENLSEIFQLEDAPDGKKFDPVKTYQDLSKSMLDASYKMRNDVYDGRQGQAKAPLFGSIKGNVKDVAPNR